MGNLLHAHRRVVQVTSQLQDTQIQIRSDQVRSGQLVRTGNVEHRCLTFTHLRHAVVVAGEVKDELCLLKHGWLSHKTHTRSLNGVKIASHRWSLLNRSDLPSEPAECQTTSAGVK